MMTNNKIEILEQRFRAGVLTEIEEDELFELLEQEGRLESWLDNNIQLTPDESIVYADKDFLKSISEPIEQIKPDITVVYENKRLLYRRNVIISLKRMASVAAAVAVILFLTTIYNQQPSSSHSEVEKMLTAVQTDIIIEPIAKPKTIIHRTIEPKVAKPVIISKAIVNTKKAPIIKKKTVIEPVINIDKTVIKVPKEIVLFAQAQTWREVDKNDYRNEEIIIEHEEWQPSETTEERNIINLFNRRKGRKI